MKLKDYFDKEGINPVVFAINLGISVTSIYRYIRGETSPTRQRARQIEKATEGKVSVAELRGFNG